MSIIVDALEKAQKPSPRSGRGAKKTKKLKKRFPHLWKYILLMTLIAVAAPFCYLLLKDKEAVVEEITFSGGAREIVNLSGIMYTPDIPLAVINDAIWCEGETVGGFKILDIKENYVRLDSNGEEITIRLKQ